MDVGQLLQEADKLYASGQVTKSFDLIYSICDDDPDNLHLQINGGIWFINKRRFTTDVLRILGRARELISNKPDSLMGYAQVVYSTVGSDPSDLRGRDALLEAIQLKPDFQPAYELLMRIHLLHNNYVEAYLVGCAARHLDINVFGLDSLAENLMKGIRACSFTFDDVAYLMPLNTTTPACVFSSQNYVHGQLTEINELRHIKSFVGQADSILEIGTLLGNHTAYFQKNLSPKRMTCVEAHPVMARMTRETAKTNQPDSHVCNTIVENVWADTEKGEIEIQGEMVDRKPIDEVAEGPYDFIKIDVDGAEMAVLAGVENTLMQGTPKVMIEASDDTEQDVLAWMDAHGFTHVHAIGHGHYNNHFYIKETD